MEIKADAGEALSQEFGSYNHALSTLKIEDFKVHVPRPEQEALFEAASIRSALVTVGENWDEFSGVLSTNDWVSRMASKKDGSTLDHVLLPLTWKSVLNCIDQDANKKVFDVCTPIPEALDDRKSLRVLDINVVRQRSGSWAELYRETEKEWKLQEGLFTGRWVLVGGFLHAVASLGLVPSSHLDSDSQYIEHAEAIRKDLFGLEDWSPPDVYIVAEIRELLHAFFAKLPTLFLDGDHHLVEAVQAWRVATCVLMEFLAENVFDPSAEWYFGKCETTESGVEIHMGVDAGYVLGIMQ